MDVSQVIREVDAALGFENSEPLTQGGQKLVLKGRISGAKAVAKIVLIEPGANGDITLRRAHREVELLSAVESNRVVKVLTDAVEIGDPVEAVCWAEEYLDGNDLSASLKSKWAEDDVWLLMHDVAEALAACHELEVVHRDLSPGNIRRTSNGHFMLMDPGLARHLEKTALTGAYQPGTPGWRSPEHAPGGDPVPASDVFSLGILSFFALTGQFPIDPPCDSQTYDRALIEQQAPPISTIRPDISPDLGDIIDRCLNRQPARRFLDGAELLTEIEKMEPHR
ncbi:serine/threonine-protein kinase [uncultured Corynebacterium sp.]|uniref:serine/threonine-protein kinase n=1 Tax=uncultured Corynebacterium sp. TaxID=159447 RepID=UPI002595C0DD|nr:serine/threonine-protein kinase [uncultured Corynebacterium sp.]